MGSFHIWHARYLQVFQPRQMLISNGQQTLGVALPWAIAACLARPGQKVISVSGDGGFHYSSVELETAVRLKCNLVHVIWRDGFYDMVRFQQKLKYGRRSGADLQRQRGLLRGGRDPGLVGAIPRGLDRDCRCVRITASQLAPIWRQPLGS